MAIMEANYSNLNYEEMAMAIGLKPKHIPLLIGSFLEEAHPILEKLQTAIEENDYETIHSAAHSIKGSAGNLRFNELHSMSREMELAGSESDSSFDYSGYLDAVRTAVNTIK